MWSFMTCFFHLAYRFKEASMFVVCVSTLLLSTVKYYSIVWIYFLIIHLSADRHLGFFHILDIINNVAMNIHIMFMDMF